MKCLSENNRKFNNINFHACFSQSYFSEFHTGQNICCHVTCTMSPSVMASILKKSIAGWGLCRLYLKLYSRTDWWRVDTFLACISQKCCKLHHRTILLSLHAIKPSPSRDSTHDPTAFWKHVLNQTICPTRKSIPNPFFQKYNSLLKRNVVSQT